MEMLPSNMQGDLDAFTKSGTASDAYTIARKKLIDYFASAWNRAEPKTTGEENYYFKIVDLMRTKKARVIGLEGVSLTYILFRYGESEFGAGVRSCKWAQLVPSSGKGVVYAGSAHFTNPQPLNFQDFLAERIPGVQLFAAKPIVPRKEP